MTTLENLTIGQTFTNGTTSVRYEVISLIDFLVKNLNTNKEVNLTQDTHVYNVVAAVKERVYVDYYGKEVKLTSNEIEFINELDEMIFESGTIVYLDTMELSYGTSVGRGVLSSLIKKNVCCIDDGMIGYSMDKY